MSRRLRKRWRYAVRRRGYVIGQTGAPRIVSTTTTIALTNAATPTNATRFIDEIDLENGTNLPTLASSNPALLEIVTGPPANTGANGGLQMPFACYPIGTAAESNDLVSVTITPPAGDTTDQPDVIQFSISGTVTAPSETMNVESGTVGAWAGAPTVPTVPT
jgi:hypothetical protein